MESIAHADLESFSADDLKKNGLGHYVEHPTTGIHCLCFAFDKGPVEIWKAGEDFPIDLRFHLEDGGAIYAHNAPFEFEMWNRIGVKKYGWPKLSIKQVHCTMAMSYSMGLPGALEKLAPALGIDQQKDMKGNRTMLKLSRPRGVEQGACPSCKGKGCLTCNYTGDGWIWWEKEHVPDQYEILYDYCKQDVVVERECHSRMMPLSKQERKFWLMDHQINSRGVQVDVKGVETAVKIVEAEKKRLDKEMRDVTNNAVATCSAVSQIKDYLKLKGVEVDKIGKADVTVLLETEIPEDIKQVLLLRQEGSKSSTAKLMAMLNRANTDGRVRGIHQYHAAHTGRWGGRGVNFQNLPRPAYDQEDIEKIVNNLTKFSLKQVTDNIDLFYGPPSDVISSCIRAFVTAAPGKDLIAIDFAAIEARVLAWLAGEEEVLEAFRTHGKVYELQAGKIYLIPMEKVDKDQRMIGKVAILALGFGGGVGAFQSMARVYGVKVSDQRANEIKLKYRAANKKIVRYWYALEEAAIRAIYHPGIQYMAGAEDREVTFLVKGSFLWCKLPSGRVLCYPYPKVEMLSSPHFEGTKETITYMTEDSYTKKWIRQSTWGGSLAENITQGVARDVLAESMDRLENNQYPVVMHVHDEAVVEVNEGDGSLEEVSAIVEVLPSWAKDLPIKAEGWRGKRYRK